MDCRHSDLVLLPIGSALMERQAADRILACNEESEKYGLKAARRAPQFSKR